MIPVTPAPEPDNFDKDVRQKGRKFTDTLTGDANADFSGKEFWRICIPDLRIGYSSICAYTCHWVPPDVGSNSADHFIPKSRSASLAYEWSNLRFVCSRMNARRGVRDVIDPFLVEIGMFELKFPTLFIVVGATHAQNLLLTQTIEVLKLNDDVAVSAREEFVCSYAREEMTTEYLGRHAPFIRQELRRLTLTPAALRNLGF